MCTVQVVSCVSTSFNGTYTRSQCVNVCFFFFTNYTIYTKKEMHF